MTKQYYRIIVILQLVAAIIMGVATITLVRRGIPEMRVRLLYRQALRDYGTGGENTMRSASNTVDRLLAIRPNLPQALAFQGRLLVELGDFERAGQVYQHLQEIAEKQPQWAPTAANGLGCIKVHQAIKTSSRQSFQEAISYFDDCLAKNTANSKDNAEIHVNAAICKLYLSDIKGASEQLVAAHDTKKLSRDALAAFYATTGSTLALAAVSQPAAAQSLIDTLPVNDDLTVKNDVTRTAALLQRSIDEFAKAIELTRGTRQERSLLTQQIYAKARLIAAGTLPANVGNRYRMEVTDFANSARCPAADRPWLRLMNESSRTVGNHEAAYNLARSLEDATAEQHYLTGAILFRLLQYPSPNAGDIATRNAREPAAAHQLELAVQDKALPPYQRFLALQILATIAEHTGNLTEVLTDLQQAQAILPKVPKSKITPQALTTFNQNLGIALWRSSQYTTAIDALRAANTPEASQLLTAILKPPVVEQLLVNSLENRRIPPSMQLFSVTVRPGGPIPVLRDNISIMIDGGEVPFVVGPAGRLYAFPDFRLREGPCEVIITVKAPFSQSPVIHKQDVDIQYKVKYK